MNVYAVTSPNASKEEMFVTEALETALVPEAVLAALVPPLPQVDPWRPRLGYPTYAQRQPTIEAAVGLDRYGPTTLRRYDFSGSPAGYAGSTRNSIDPLG